MPAHPGALVITELMVDPKQLRDTDGEWFELWNSTNETFDLAGCAVDDGSAQPHPITAHHAIEPHAFVSIARSAQPGFVPDLVATFTLSNSADTLALLCGDMTIDRVDYSKTAGFPLAAGISASLDPAQFDTASNDHADAWCLAMTRDASAASDIGSPGRANPACATDEDAGVLTDASVFEEIDP
jgi:hypothetical protein